MHLLQGLLAEEVNGLIHIQSLDLDKSAILLASADLIKHVFSVCFGPLEAKVHDGVHKVGFGESSLL